MRGRKRINDFPPKVNANQRNPRPPKGHLSSLQSSGDRSPARLPCKYYLEILSRSMRGDLDELPRIWYPEPPNCFSSEVLQNDLSHLDLRLCCALQVASPPYTRCCLEFDHLFILGRASRAVAEKVGCVTKASLTPILRCAVGSLETISPATQDRVLNLNLGV